MVRLKHIVATYPEKLINKSQFHYGSIKTPEKLINKALRWAVSIPLWFD